MFQNLLVSSVRKAFSSMKECFELNHGITSLSEKSLTIEQEKEKRCRILLSIQRALVGAISDHLKVVTVDWTDSKIIIFFFYNDEISEDDRDIAECVAALVMSNCELQNIETKLITIPDFKPVPKKGKDIVFCVKGIQIV
jgi:hypothetical protein